MDIATCNTDDHRVKFSSHYTSCLDGKAISYIYIWALTYCFNVLLELKQWIDGYCTCNSANMAIKE